MFSCISCRNKKKKKKNKREKEKAPILRENGGTAEVDGCSPPQVTDVVLPGQHEHSVRQSLLQWSQQTVSGYPIKITDFSRCWRDGRAFLYLIHRNRPNLVNMRQVASNSSQENLELAFSTAEKELGVTRLLDPEDMQVDQPDEKSVITYVASLYNVFPLPSPTTAVHDNDLASKTSEYEALAKPLLLWLKEQTSRCTSREFSATLVEVKSDIAEFQKFRLEDIPAKLASKRRLEILFHEIEPLACNQTMIGQLPLDEQIHIDSLTQHWDRFASVVDNREQALHSEVARLQRLQKLAEKVHKDTKLCEGYLDDVEQRLLEELSRYESIHPLDAKDNCAVLQQILNKIDSHIQSQLTDVQNLKDGRYHQADSMYKRVQSVHQRLEGLMNRLQTELLPKIRSVGTVEPRASSSISGTALTSSSYRLSSSSVGSGAMSPAANTSMSAASSASPVTRQPHSSVSASPLLPGSTSDMMSQGSSQASVVSAGIPHSQSMMSHSSGAELLKECIEWVESRRKLLDPSTLEFTSVGKLEKTVNRLRAEHDDVLQFKSRLQSCHQARNRMPNDEVQAFSQWLGRVESAYSSILSISSQQLQQCESLLEFAKDSTDELRWLNEKEEEELTRNWNATTMNADVMKEHFQVFLWKRKRLMEDLQQHERQFNGVQDRGEDIVRQKAIGSPMCQSYLTAMQERWGWLLQVLSCIDVHLKNAQSYNQFCEEVEECSGWLKEQTKVLNMEFNRSNINIEEGDRLMKHMQSTQNTLAHYEQVIKSLQDRQSFIVPHKMRSTIQKHPVPVNALCSFSQDDFLMEKGEECILLDNKDPQKWRVRNSRAAAGVVPSICLTFPPPDAECKRQVQLLEDQFQAFLRLWKEKQRKLKMDMVFATAQVVKHWDITKFKSLGAAEREAVMKALNSDAQRLLTESSELSDNKQAKLRDTLQKCNDHYTKLKKKLRDKESKEPRSAEEKAEETIANISYSLRSLDDTLSIRLTEPIPRDMETLQKQAEHQKTVEEVLTQASTDLESLRRTGLVKSFHNNNNPLAAKQQNLSGLASTYQQRLHTTQDVLQGLSECTDKVFTLERRISPLETVTNDVDRLSDISQQIHEIKEELGECRAPMLRLEENSRLLRQLVERSRADVDSHPDMDKLDRDVSQVLNKWQHLCDDADTKLRNVDKSLEILTLYSRSSGPEVEAGQGGAQSSVSPREMFANLQERGSTLSRIRKSGQSSRSIKNKLEELYEELSKDLHKELQWGRGVEKALAAQQGLISTEEYLRQQIDEHKHLLEDLQAHQQLARTIVYQNEQLRDQEVSILTPEEVYEQDALHAEMTNRLVKVIKEVDNRVKHLTNCYEEVVKLNSEQGKLDHWLNDAETTLNDMHKRTNQLSRLRDVTDRYKAFQSEVITHQADLRFLDLSSQKYVAEANSYKKRLMAFKADCQGTRSSLILEEENYAVKEDVSKAKERFHELLTECSSQVDNLDNVSETQRRFNEACDRLESWLQMAEKNLGALKREPIKTQHLELQEQLDRVRDFTNAVMAQEKLIDDLRLQGQSYSEALAQTRVDGRHVEDIHETVNDLNCRHGLVAAEAIARANILNTAMVQSQGLTASIDALLSLIQSTENSVSTMKPISLNLENLEEQVGEFKLFEADVESHKSSVSQINSHASEVINSCSPSLAAILETKLQQLNQRSQELTSKCRERARDVRDVYSELKEFNTRSAELTQWMLTQTEALSAADNNNLNAQQLKAKHAAIQSQVELKKCSYDAMLLLGKKLKENPSTGQVTSVKETMNDLELSWSEFELALEECSQQVTMKEEHRIYYNDLLEQVNTWMSSMERRIDCLDPVAMDIQLIESQIGSIQPLLNEYEEHSAKMDAVYDIGNKCGGLVVRSSSPSRRTSGATHLSEVQREMGESNHRYELIGERLTDRQSEMEATLSGLKSYLTDVQHLMVYLNEVEPQVAEVYTPRDAADAKRQLQEYRQFNENFQSRGILLEQLRQRVYELTANRESVPGMLEIETQLAQLEDRWKGVQQASLSRCISLEGIESNLAHFTDTSNFLSTWLLQKEKMLGALGPIATEPNMVKSQLHQVQVLDDELRSQQTKCDHCLECGIQILEKTPAESEQAIDINNRLDSLSKNWHNLESFIKVRRDNLKAVLDNSGDLHDTLGYINEWLLTASDKVQALAEERVDTQTEANMISKLKSEMEKNEKMVKYAQELSRKLMDSVKQPVAEAEIKQKMMAVSRPFSELKRKLGAIDTENQSKTGQERAINSTCDNMLQWLKSSSQEIQAPLSLSASDSVLKEQIRNHERLSHELTDQEQTMKNLKNQTEKLQSTGCHVPADIEAKLAAVSEEWENVTRNAERRDKAIRAVSSQADQVTGDHQRLQTWLDMTEEKLASVSKTTDDKDAVDGGLREVQALQSEISRKKPELIALLQSVQEFLTAVDTDKEAVADEMDTINSRWRSLEHLVDNSVKSLDSKASKLSEQHDILNDVTKQVKECEDILASHNALGTNAYDSKHMGRIKRPSVQALTDTKTLLSAQSQLRQLRPKLEAVHVAEVNGHPLTNGESQSRIVKESEDLLTRFDALDMNIDTWVGQVESASKQVKDFQGIMKTATGQLSDLDDQLENFTPISRDAKTLRQQLEQVRALEVELTAKEDTMAHLETQCRKLTHAGYIQEPQLHKAQIDSMKKQIGKLQSKASLRTNNVVNKLDGVDNFDTEAQSIQRDMMKAGRVEKCLKPVASDVKTIKVQQKEFKTFCQETVEPIHKRVEEINKAGLNLVRTADGGVPTDNIEADLEAINTKWAKLAEQVEERDKRLDIALLQTGKYKESMNSILDWMSETEEMVNHQKPPSAEYKVAKAQLQEQKFLQKMINDRAENVEAVQQIAAQINEQTDAREKQQVSEEVKGLITRWNDLKHRVDDRSKSLDENLDVTKVFHDSLEPFVIWMDKTERRQSLAPPIAADLTAMANQSAEQKQLNSEIEAKATELGAVLKRGQDLLRRSHGDDTRIIQDKLSSLENRYTDLEHQGQNRLAKIETAMPIAQNFQTSCGQLLEWLDKVEPAIESTRAEKTSETEALQLQLADIEPVFEMVVSEGASLTRLVPGEGAENISQVLNKTQKQFAQISDQIMKKVANQKAAQEMKLELENSADDLSEWFADTEAKLTGISPCSSDPDDLRRQLQDQKMVNDELVAQKGRLKQLTTTARKLQRDGLILESPALNDKLESVKIQADSLSRRCTEQLGQVEQIVPLASQFKDLHEDLTVWLEQAEQEIQEKAVTPDQIQFRQQANKALGQEVTDQKPFVDRLAKVGPNLARLCNNLEAGDVNTKLESVLDRYQSLKSAVKDQSDRLKEKDEHAQKFTEAVEDILTDLQTTKHAVVAAEPVAAKPAQLRDQLEANKAIIERMNEKLSELELVKADADRMIEDAGGIEDDSVTALKQKIANLSKMYNDVKKATEDRNAALVTALHVSDDFWTGLDVVKYQLQDVGGSLETEDKPALDPDHLREQQEKMQALWKRLSEMEDDMANVTKKGDKLSELVGESEQPVVTSSVSGVSSEYDALKESWRERLERLQTALKETNKFQAELVEILNWLQGKEEKLASLGSVPGDTKSVKAQIESLKHYTSDVNDKYLQVEALNQQAANMVSDRPDSEAKVIKQPMSEVNKRWKCLLDGIGQRKTKLQNALLSLGQFQAAVAELTQWLDRTEKILTEENLPQPMVCGDPKIIEIELAKHKILLNDVQSHQSSIDQVNVAGQQVISSEGGAEASTTRHNLDLLNHRWEAVLGKTKNWQLNLEDALREALEYQSSLNDMVQRLSEIDGQLSTSKLVGGLPETAKEQLEEFMGTYNELEQAQPRVAQLIQAGEDLLEKGNEVSAQSLQQNLDNLKARWDLVTNRATEKKAQLENALQQAESFHEEQASFVNWLTATEKAFDKQKSPGCTLDTMQSQIADHKELSHDVTVHKEKAQALDKTSIHLRYFSHKSDATLIKNTALNIQHRWDKILSRLAERSRALDRGLKDAKSFNDYWTDLCQWLDNSDQLLDSGQLSTNDADKIKTQIVKHKEFQRALGSKQPTYDLLMKQGKELLVKSADENDTQTIGAMLTSLKSKWTNVCGKSIDRQRKLEESLLFSGQFKDALQALLGWLCKIEPFISDEQNVHGDLDTVTKLADQQAVFQLELSKRASNMAQVRDTAKELIEKSEDSMPELQAQLIELTTSWDTVTKQAEKRQARIEEAFKLAEDFGRRANGFLEWVADCEQQLKVDPDKADDEVALQAALDEHKAYIDVIDKQRQYLTETLRLGEDILSKAHQEAVPIMKKWMIVLQQRIEDVDAWSAKFEKSLQESLDTLRNSSTLIEELMGWLASSESTLTAMEEDPLPLEASLIEDMLREHQDFEAEIASRQSEVDRLTKPKRRGDRSGAATPTGRRSSTGTPSGRRSKADLRRSSQTPEPALKNPRVQALSVKWRQVWLMTMDRRRRLQDALDQQRERARLRNFNFDEWKRRYMDWMNHNKTRVMDFFRRIDKDRDGKVSRTEFVTGILQSKFPTSQPELEAVADKFDKNKDGFIDYKEFMAALRTEIEREQEKKSDAERIHEEVEKQVTKCCCQKQFAIQKVSDNKYVFGESQKLRLVRILRSTVMVRVGGGWQALDEFLVKNDPCRAKGRTNTELREKFILSDNVVGQGMSSFTNRPSTSSRLSGGTRSGSTTPVVHSHYHHHHHPTTPVQRGTTPDTEVSAIMSHRSRDSPSYAYSGGVNSLPSSRASSRCSDISEDTEPYNARESDSRTTPSGSANHKSRIPLSRNSSIKKPSYY